MTHALLDYLGLPVGPAPRVREAAPHPHPGTPPRSRAAQRSARRRPRRPEPCSSSSSGEARSGYYLAKELIESGHEVVLMEKDPARAAQIADDIGSDGRSAATAARATTSPRPAASGRTWSPR